MQKIQIEKTIKKLNEFEESEQEQIVNNYRDINVNYEGWNDYILEDFAEEIKIKTGLEIALCDITWAVGDRNAKFGVYSKTIINQLLAKFEKNGVYDIYVPDKLGSFLSHLGGGICRQGSTELNLVEVYFEDDTEQKELVIKQINEIINIVIELSIKNFVKQEDEYRYLISDEMVKETICMNDYDFDVETLKIF